MAENSGVQKQIQQQHFQQQNNSPFQCKECGLSLNSAGSLEVHLQYHKENLLKHWAIQATSSHSEETNNNNTKASVKRESNTTNPIATADSSDSMHKKSPEYSRTTPETIFGHPPTPQSYHSAASPYQNQDNSSFSPNFSNFQQKNDRTSPNSQPQYQQTNYQNYTDQQYFGMEPGQNQQYSEAYAHNKGNPMQNAAYRYHPYSEPQQNNYERQQTHVQVSTGSPVYPPQPTPSPSPKQCDKCGYVCESATLLIEHLNMAHPPTPLSAYQPNQHFMFDQPPIIKQEDQGQSEILDLDSHKVVHNVFPEEAKLQNGDPIVHNPHSVTALLNPWNPAQQQKMFPQHPGQEQRMFMNAPEQKMFNQNIPDNIPEKMYSPDQKLFQPQMHNQDFLVNGVNTTQENAGSNMGALGQPLQGYRPFEHLTSPPNTPVIASTQVASAPAQPPPVQQKNSANWKSNEARRPKTYNCTACNKWFTSSGHLKRHYNTTLHKNAVKSSGQPDPASMPISSHHHPARENPSKQEDRPQSGSSGDEIRSDDNGSLPQFERMGAMPGLLQQPPSSPYDRQPAPNILHTTPLHSPMGHSPMGHSPMGHSPMAHSPMAQHPSPLGGHLVNPSLSNLSNGSPPNGEAGLSPTNVDSRGLLSLSSPPINTPNTLGFNMAPQHMMPMDSGQFQMYPNELAPHVTQAMDISSHSTTGEYQFAGQSVLAENQPLPSFAQIQGHRYGLLGYDVANVGGGGSVTTPYSFYMQPNHVLEANPPMMYRAEEDDYKLTILTPADPSMQTEYMIQYSPTYSNNLSDDQLDLISVDSENEPYNRFHVMEDFRLDGQPETAHTIRDSEEIARNRPGPSTMPPLHKCYECDKIFNKACYLTQHNKTFHSGDKPFKCTRCGKRFSCEIIYEEHLKKHAGEKPHKCHQCPKQFNHKTDLRRHMCLHTGHKPFACETCGKGFIRKDHMMKHYDTHLRKTQATQAKMEKVEEEKKGG